LPVTPRTPVTFASVSQPSSGFVQLRKPPVQVGEISGEVLRILQDPEFVVLFGPDSRAEVPVVATLYDSAGKIQALTGQIDRLLVRERDCVILDYKSNRPPPMQVGERGRGHDEHGHAEAVRRDDPLQPGFADGEPRLDRRQRHIHDQRVEEDHEKTEAGRDECDALCAIHRRFV